MDVVYTERDPTEKGNPPESSPQPQVKKKNILRTILIIIAVIIVVITIILIIYFCAIKKEKNKPGNNQGKSDNKDESNQNDESNPNNESNPNDESKNDDEESQPNDESKPQPIDVNPVHIEEDIPLSKEFEIKTELGLRIFSVVQNTIEENKLKGTKIITNIKRITNYTIYFLSEEKADNNTQKYFNSTFLGAIAISSDCYDANGEDCQPQKLVDLFQENTNKTNNIRRLKSVEDLKDIPIALCLVNITDNNFILSFECPESFPETKKNEILLDLYFYKPPAIQRPDKKNDGINVTTREDQPNNKRYIRETNEGTCNIENNLGSICFTDMNSTTDLNGTLLSYDELAITNITFDENNSYVKIKKSNLVDTTGNKENLNSEKYKKNLDKLLDMLKPYMKKDEEFSMENFKELYYVVHAKKNSQEVYVSEKKKGFRNLLQYVGHYIPEENLFKYDDIGGIEIYLTLKANSGINSDSVSSYSNLIFDSENHYLSDISHLTDLDRALNALVELSKAGNHLATQLYEQIKNKLEIITNDISIKIISLNDLLEYYELSEIFDATLSLDSINILPIHIIEETKTMENKLKTIFEEVATGNTKYHVDNLKDYVYEYNKNLQTLVQKIFNNLKDLSDILLSEQNELTEITTYYLNYTSYSYVKIIQEIENILNNSYINSGNIINTQIEDMLAEFEKNYIDTLKSSKKVINHLIYKLENKSYSIEYATDEDFKNMISYLYNSYKNTEDIFSKIKEYIKRETGIKANGYFITDDDIKKNNESFFPVIKKSKEVAEKLDDDSYIDKVFDNIMIMFENNITDIIMNMEKLKEQKFDLQENVLKYSIFSDNEKNKLQKQITNIKVKVNTDIKSENDYYIDEIKKTIKNFEDNDIKKLNDLILELDSLLSEENVKNLAQKYDTLFNSILNKRSKDITNNEELANQYLDEYIKAINDNNYIQQLLYDNDKIPQYALGREFKLVKYQTVYSKRKTNGYLSKLNTFKANFEYLKKYIDENLDPKVKNIYKTILSKIKEDLQTIRNNKITEKYPDFPEFDFYNNNLRIIDKLFSRFNKYLSDDIFNSKYINQINKAKTNNKSYISKIQTNINNKHNKINLLETNSNSQNDICIYYRRKVCYGCTNCAYNTYKIQWICVPLAKYSTNHLKLINTDINTDSNLINFNSEFNTFYQKLDKIIKNYNSIWSNLENKFNSIKKETLNKQMVLNYLQPLQNWVNTVLSEKYGDELIKASYNFYQLIIDERLKIIYNDSLDKINTTFDNFISEIETNYDLFTNSISEYRIMATIYNTIFQQNSTKDFFNIIINFQKTEFNYTISYYYLYLKKTIDEAYQYILSKIPINEKGFNDIINMRTNEINNLFNSIYSNILNSKNEALSIYKQRTLLNVPETNFFKVNYIMTDYLYDLKECLDEKITLISKFKSIYRDETSLVARFYLEIQQNWNRTQTLYEQVNHQVFVLLNLDQFEEVVFENWIFDQDNLISKLSYTLTESIKDIRNDFLIEKENYITALENEIDRQFKDESIEMKIINLYSSGIKTLTNAQIENIKNNINLIISNIKEKIQSESNRLETTSTSYNSDYSKIRETLGNIKSQIENNFSTTTLEIINGVYKNIEKNFYEDCLVTNLDNYLEVSLRETTKNEFKDYQLYNSSYKIGEITQNLLEDITNTTKATTKNLIYQKYVSNLDKIKSTLNYQNIINSMKNEIDSYFDNILLKSLEKYATYDPEKGVYPQYDFSDIIKDEINSVITEKMNNIKTEIEKTKGPNYEAKTNCFLDFSLSGIDVVKKVCENFTNFLKVEKEEQKKKINVLIKTIINSNFQDLLENVVPSFGELFFQRIIKFNENFKINSLYNNLKFSLAQTLIYYKYLYITTSDVLPKELKIRIYKLNNLDSVVEEKNNQILKLLEKKINEFITKSRKDIMERYKHYLLEDISIQNSFDKNVLDKINDNLLDLQPTLESNYETMVESFFKEKLISSYSNFMNKKTNEMIKTVYEQKELLKAEIDDLFTLDSEKVLSDINEKINITLDSINEYNAFIETFFISNDIKEYINEFALSKVLPVISDFQIELNKVTKDKIVENINKNSEKIESLNPEQFINDSKNYTQYFNNNYFIDINSSIENYGIDDYKKNLDLERKNKGENLRRRLSGEETEEEMAKYAKEKINDKGIDESFQRILNLSLDIQSFLNGLEAFSDFEKKINNYIKKVNLAYKKSSELIFKNNYTDDTESFLNEKLSNLTNISLNYYTIINESYFDLKNYLNKSIIDIISLLNKCQEITYKTFNQEYRNISNKTKNLSIKNSTIKKRINDIPYIKNTEHSHRKVTTKITDLIEYSEIVFNVSFEGDTLKKPKVSLSNINGCHPKKIKFIISSPFGNCGESITEVEAQFNDANYTLNLDYGADASNIYVTTYTNFEKYTYTTEAYQLVENNETDSVDAMGIELGIVDNGECIRRDRKIVKNKETFVVDAKSFNQTKVIEC